MAKPIIVIARNRSGSKWLSNIIARHSDIACIQRRGAGGIIETNLFGEFPELFGDLAVADSYLGFALCFTQTNFYRMTGLEQDILFRKEMQQKDYFEIFRWIMDEVARREGKNWWIQKASVRRFQTLLQKFPDASFLIIERDMLSNISSSFGLKAKQREAPPSLLREIFSCAHTHKTIRHFSDRSNVMSIRYEDLLRDRSGTVKTLCEHIGLEFQPGMLQDDFEPNTSYVKNAQRGKALTPIQQRLVNILGPMVKRLPYRFLNLLASLGANRSRKRPFIPLTYRLLETELGWEPPEAFDDQHWLSRSPDTLNDPKPAQVRSSVGS